MLRRLGRLFTRPGTSNAIAIAALFIALGGASYAAIKVPAGSVGTKQLKNNAVSGKKLKKNAVTGAKVSNGSLAAGDFAAGQLPVGATGPQGVQGIAGVTGATGPSNPNADTLDGVDSAGFVKYGSVIPSGVTVRGVFGVFAQDHDFSQAFTSTARTFVSLPAEAPVALTDADVNFRSAFAFDADPGCTGTSGNPTAPAGKVCIYEVSTIGTIASAFGRGSFSLGQAAKFGFEVEVTQASASNVNGPYVSGSWAYTAP